MRVDIDRWDQKYKDANPNPTFEPDPILVVNAVLLDGQGTALDVACGVGHNAIFLAQRGYDVVAIDGSLSGLRYGRAVLQNTKLPVSLVVADLEALSLPMDFFSLVLVVRYLYRPLIAQLKRALRPGGLIIYKTFNVNYQRERPAFHPDYLLEPGELATIFADFELIATNDSQHLVDSTTFWIGRRPAHVKHLSEN